MTESKQSRGRRLATRHYPESSFGGYPTICPDTNFYTRVNSLLKPESIAIDLGCGRGIDEATPYLTSLKRLRGKCQHVYGLDVDPDAATNDMIDEFRLIDRASWPIESDTVDVLVGRYVLEHVADPSLFFRECYRVLRSGGVAAFLTSNLLSYVGLAAKMIPNGLHQRVIRRVHLLTSRSDEDVFPTFHRCNTPRRLRKQLAQAGFESCVFGLPAPPNYLTFSSVAYAIGVAYQKLAPMSFQPALVAFARKR